jgi:hypothetical protein
MRINLARPRILEPQIADYSAPIYVSRAYEQTKIHFSAA